MNTTNNEDFMFPQFSMGGSVRERTIPTKVYTLYLDGEIGAPCEYRDHMEALESANEWDEVRVIISSGGGRLDSGLMLIDGIKACRAPVTAYIHDICGSMATGVALACQNWLLGDFAYFFVHTASWGTFGKDSEIRSHVQFMDKRIDKFLHSMYDGFMSSEEISLVGKGQDLWIDSEELKGRLEAYQEYRSNQPCDCGNENCEVNQRLAALEQKEDFDDIPTIDEIVEQAVTKALIAYDKQKDEAAKKLARKSKTKSPQPAMQPEGFDLIIPKAELKNEVHIRVFPSWVLAKEDIKEYRENCDVIAKFNVRESKAYLETGDVVYWMVSNGSDVDKFQGLRVTSAYFHKDVKKNVIEYVNFRI